MHIKLLEEHDSRILDSRILENPEKKNHKNVNFVIVKTIGNTWFSLIFIKFHWFCLFSHDCMWVFVQNEHAKCVLWNFHPEIFLMRTANYKKNALPENWIASTILSHIKKNHKGSQFTIMQNHQKSLIFIDFHSFSLILLVLPWVCDGVCSKWASQMKNFNFQMEIFLMCTSNY